MRKMEFNGSKHRILSALRALDNKIVAKLSKRKTFMPLTLDINDVDKSGELILTARMYDSKNLKHYISSKRESSILRIYIYIRHTLFNTTYTILKRMKSV